jgi:steroid 5-alpha reductase family enzyme
MVVLDYPVGNCVSLCVPVRDFSVCRTCKNIGMLNRTVFHEVVILGLVLLFCGVHELATSFQEILCVMLLFLYSVRCNKLY